MTEHPGDQPTEPTRPADAASPSEPVAPAPPPSAPMSPETPTAPQGGSAPYDLNRAKGTLQGADPFVLGIVAAGVVAFFASMLPFYTASVGAGGISISAHISAWHGFFGWFAALLALGGAVLVALPLFDVALPMVAHQAAAVAFGVALLCLVVALFAIPGGGCQGVNGLAGIQCDTGHGFGYWLALLAVLVGLGLSLMRARSTVARAA
jgi:hypothetical protein